MKKILLYLFIYFIYSNHAYAEKFICPNCNFIKRYLVKTSRDYFRLFFIPIIPVGEKSQPYVECQHCKNNWHTNVLDQNNYYLDGKPVTK